MPSPVLSLPRYAKKIALSALVALAFLGLSSALAAEGRQSRENRGRWQREDIAVFRDEFLALDRAFTPEARKQAQRRLAKLERRATSPTGFAVELCRIAA